MKIDVQDHQYQIKFTRIQDLFPIYGEVIDAIVNKLEFAKDLAGGL